MLPSSTIICSSNVNNNVDSSHFSDAYVVTANSSHYSDTFVVTSDSTHSADTFVVTSDSSHFNDTYVIDRNELVVPKEEVIDIVENIKEEIIDEQPMEETERCSG